jgi:hypothetical protein
MHRNVLLQIMLRSPRSTLCWAIPCLCLGLAGCEIGQGLADLAQTIGNNPAEGVDGDGDQIIEGSFRNVRFDGNNADGVFVVAIEALPDEEASTRLRLIPYLGAEGACSAGSATTYAQAVNSPGGAETKLDARIPLLTRATEEEPRKLRFSNFKCQLDDVEVEGASLPINQDFAARPGFITQTEGQELYFVSPWENEVRRIASNAAVVAREDRALFAEGQSGLWMWTIEGGEIVARDREFKEVGRLGVEVQELVHSSSGTGGPMVAYKQSNGEVYVALTSDLAHPRLLTGDGCELSLRAGQSGRQLVSYSPCTAKDVVSFELETDTRQVLASAVSGYRIVGDRSDGPVLLYVTNEDGNRSVGTLWARFGEELPLQLGELGHLGLTRLNVEGELKAVLNWGETGGTLSLGTAGEKLTKLADNVIYWGGVGIIADWDGAAGTLYNFEKDETLTRVQRRVSTRGIRYDGATERGLVLVDFDGEQGALTLIRQGEATKMSENVRPDSYQFTVQLPTVTILSDLDPKSGAATLKLRRLDSEEETVVSDGVSETLEVSWPEAGFLYSVPAGERAGIWFSKAL